MANEEQTLGKKMKINIRNSLISGILIAIPFMVTLVIIRWLFSNMAGFLGPIVSTVLPRLAKVFFTNPIPDTYLRFAVTTISIFLLILLLYIVGVIGHRVFGKRLIAMGETLLLKIPIVRAVYGSTKQVMKTMSISDHAMFKTVVLVEFPRAGMKSLGFLTGYISDAAGKKYCKIFIPTAPNPTTGFFELIPPEEIAETNITVEDGFKMIISCGVVSPGTFDYVKKNQRI